MGFRNVVSHGATLKAASLKPRWGLGRCSASETQGSRWRDNPGLSYHKPFGLSNACGLKLESVEWNKNHGNRRCYFSFEFTDFLAVCL